MKITNKKSLFPIKRTTLEHQVPIFYHIYLYGQELLQRVHFLTCKMTKSKTLALFLMYSFDISTDFGSLLRNFTLKKNHHVSHAISGKSMCSKHCLLKFTVCFAFCYVDNWLTLFFFTFYKSLRKGCTIS